MFTNKRIGNRSQTARSAESQRRPFILQPEYLEDRCLLSSGLDPGLGTGGTAIVTFDSTVKVGSAAALQVDGKIVSVGVADPRTTPDTFAGGFSVGRANPDGTKDTTFGANGLVTTEFGTNSLGANAVLVQPDGKILVAGEAPGQGSTQLPALARYNTDGTLDTTFGTSGKVVTDPGFSTAGGAISMARASDGSIFIVGGANNDFALAKYSGRGVLDTTFGTNGFVTTDFSGQTDQADGVQIQSDGKIVVAGISNTAFALARYNTDGSLDTTFGTGGKVTTTFDPNNASTTAKMALQSDGKIVLVGGAFTNISMGNQYDMAVLRYTTAGVLDSTFGTGGKVTIDFGRQDLGSSVFMESNGKIVVGGVTGDLPGTPPTPFNPNPTHSFAVARLTTTGQLDVSFGTSGKAITPISAGFGTYSHLPDVMVQQDGKVLLAGSIGTGLGLARYADTSTQGFLAGLYHDLLGRGTGMPQGIDPAGFNFWVTQLQQGASRSDVVSGFQASSEHRTFIVSNLYQDILGRSADTGGLATWSKALETGATVKELRARFLGSNEYFLKTGPAFVGFLEGLYQYALHRSLDESGRFTFTQALAAGATREAVALTVLRSPEEDNVAVDSLFMEFLNRPADSGGLNSFVPGLQAGVPDEQIAHVILSSDEYFAIH